MTCFTRKINYNTCIVIVENNALYTFIDNTNNNINIIIQSCLRNTRCNTVPIILVII